MTASELVPWFQIASTVLTGIGIIVSLLLGVASLNNNRRDRLAKVRPDLLFNTGGQMMSASIAPFETFAGKTSDDPAVQAFMKTLPAGAKCLALQDSFGQLVNIGQGPALSTAIWFEPQEITAAAQARWLKPSEQLTPPYAPDWNRIPATPATLANTESGSFRILPGSVYAAAPDVSVISGKMRIECRDLEGNQYQWTQDATFFIDRVDGKKADVTVSFEPRLRR